MTEPIHILSLGAGVQSSTMALMAAHGEITPMPKCAIFADTQDEPQSVYTWLDWLEKQLPFPVHRETAGRLSEKILRMKWRRDNSGFARDGSLPVHLKNQDGSVGFGNRHCTRDFKVDVLRKAARRISNVKRGSKTIHVIQWIGISLDEVQRMKPSRDAWIEHRWPLVDLRMKRHNCLLWMERNGYPRPPRSACIFCPYHSDSEWRDLRDNSPDEFRQVVEFEKQLQISYSKTDRKKAIPFLHSSVVPLDQVDFSTDEDHGQQVMFGNECEGMCGV